MPRRTGEDVRVTVAVDVARTANRNTEVRVRGRIVVGPIRDQRTARIAEEHFDGPVFVTDYPRDQKAFYMRQNDDGDVDHDVVPFLVTACPYEAQDYLDSGEDIVEPVAMPEPW